MVIPFLFALIGVGTIILIYISCWCQDIDKIKRSHGMRILKETDANHTERYYLQNKCFLGIWWNTYNGEHAWYEFYEHRAIARYKSAQESLKKRRNANVIKKEIVYP